MNYKATFAQAARPIVLGLGSASNLGKIKNVNWTLGQLAERLANFHRDDTPHGVYLKLPVEAQVTKKAAAGFWFGGPSKDGRRANDAIAHRTCVTLDLDEATPELAEDLSLGATRLNDFLFICHSTRKHQADKPRFRVVLPISRDVTAEEYHALSRILAEMADPTMDQVDDVSFRPAQMMYMPTVSKDAPYVFFVNEGPIVDVDAVLAAFGDWQDHSALPFSERQGQKRFVDPSRKAEDPRTKKGVIGAFCNTYSIEDAIEKFLPDVYVPGDTESGKPRYTFVQGSTTNGAVVEDDGLFLYSHHTSDPCSDRLVNAFDLVRLHLFGDEDKGQDPKTTSPTEFRSFKAMEEFLSDDKPTIAALNAARYDLVAMFDDVEGDEDEDALEERLEDEAAGPSPVDAAAAFDDLDDGLDEEDLALIGGDAPAPEKAKKGYDSSWIETLDITAKGGIKSSMPNHTIILQHDPRIAPAIEYNEFIGEIVSRRPLKSRMKVVPDVPVRDRVNGVLWSDKHDMAVRMILEAPNGPGKPGYGLKVADRDLEGAVYAAALQNRFHPVNDYLDGLKWDGVARLEKVWSRYLGVPDDAYARETARLFFVAAVARVKRPGHKFDYVPILEGLQGKRKSTFIKILARRWFAELEGSFSDRKRLVEQMQGAWILEIPELSGFNRHEVTEIKAFITTQADKVRLAYASRSVVFPRQNVFMGSTNEDEYLADLTGGRRFWPLRCSVVEIDTDHLEANVDQIWAEAVAAYHTMAAETGPDENLPLFLRDSDAQLLASGAQESRRVTTEADAFAGLIKVWLDTPVDQAVIDGADARFANLDGDGGKVYRNRTCLPEIWEVCLGNERRHYDRTKAMMLARSMRLVGWELKGPLLTAHWDKQKTYVRPVDQPPPDMRLDDKDEDLI